MNMAYMTQRDTNFLKQSYMVMICLYFDFFKLVLKWALVELNLFHNAIYLIIYPNTM